MITRILIASGIIFAVFALWTFVVQAGRRFATRHPELGRYREEGGECGKTCGCKQRSECRIQSAEIGVHRT
jgi:hypothetical protein